MPTPTPISPTRPDQLPGDADSVGPGGRLSYRYFTSSDGWVLRLICLLVRQRSEKVF